MPSKLQFYTQMADHTARQVTGSFGEWTAFLETAGRLYKYPFHEQLMIFAQKPNATACADYDLWNRQMGRYVRRGSKGIALIDTNGDNPRLRYFSFACPTHDEHGDLGCTCKRKRKADMDEAVFHAIRTQMNVFMDSASVIKSLLAQKQTLNISLGTHLLNSPHLLDKYDKILVLRNGVFFYAKGSAEQKVLTQFDECGASVETVVRLEPR